MTTGFILSVIGGWALFGLATFLCDRKASGDDLIIYLIFWPVGVFDILHDWYKKRKNKAARKNLPSYILANIIAARMIKDFNAINKKCEGEWSWSDDLYDVAIFDTRNHSGVKLQAKINCKDDQKKACVINNEFDARVLTQAVSKASELKNEYDKNEKNSAEQHAALDMIERLVSK